MMNIGEKVRIIHSPYFSIKNGTEAYIINKLFEKYGKSWIIYVLDTKPCFSFREHELEKMEIIREIK
jgi:hypothetical protein